MRSVSLREGHGQAADERLRAVAAVDGGAGPWAVAGYRMGEFALGTLGLARGSFDLEVVHFTPQSVQFSCIADGAAAATGASLGKLNLSLSDATADELRTTCAVALVWGAPTKRQRPPVSRRASESSRRRSGAVSRAAQSSNCS